MLLGLLVDSVTGLTAVIVVSGLLLGIVNTALTEAVMEATDLPRNVASSTSSGIRFMGGAIAPAVAGPVAVGLGASAPYWMGAASVVVAIAILASVGRVLSGIGRPHETAAEEACTITAADA